MEGTDLMEAYNLSPLLNIEPSHQKQSQQQQRPQQQQQPQQQQHSPQLQSRDAPMQVERKSTPIQVVHEKANEYEMMVNAQNEVYFDPRQAISQQATVLTQPFVPAVRYPQKTTSYFDAMVQKRRDVLKMVSFAIIILLAISIHTVVDFGLKEFIMSSDFTFKQELGVRLVYPFIVILLMWNIKALTWAGK